MGLILRASCRIRFVGMRAENEPAQIGKEPVFRIFAKALIVCHESFFHHIVQLSRDVILGSWDSEGFIIIIEAISLGSGHQFRSRGFVSRFSPFYDAQIFEVCQSTLVLAEPTCDRHDIVHETDFQDILSIVFLCTGGVEDVI